MKKLLIVFIIIVIAGCSKKKLPVVNNTNYEVHLWFNDQNELILQPRKGDVLETKHSLKEYKIRPVGFTKKRFRFNGNRIVNY